LVTLIGPVVADDGTLATIWLADQLMIVDDAPLNATVLDVVPNPTPKICTWSPSAPVFGLKSSMAKSADV
jgi:hypothetical protein